MVSLADTAAKVAGLSILKIELEDSTITIRLERGAVLTLRDEGQSCCEDRYITTDDDIEDLANHKLLSVEVVDGPGAEEQDYVTHEVQFLNINTSQRTIQFAAHNVHNGYYGGFRIRARAKLPTLPETAQHLQQVAPRRVKI